MKKILTLLTVFILSFTIVQAAHAGWWIFGQGVEGININYLYINKNSFDETNQKIKFYSDSLKDGMIELTGKATVGNGSVGAVYVSTDNKATWQKAKLSKNGAFNYSFLPIIDKEYDLYIKIIDTTGQTNEVEETYRKIVVVNENIRAAVNETLNAVIKAYENEETNLFMSYVSPDFAGDEAVLDFAIRKDFTAFDYIQLQPFINNISSDPTGRIFVSINYLRTVISSRSGQAFTDKGFTELVFKNENGKLKIFSMKNPLIFGLSDAGEVATGTINSTTNDPIILVNSQGTVVAQPFTQAITTINQNSSDFSVSESGSFSITSSGGANPGDFDFSSDSVVTAFTGDLTIEGNALIPGTGAGIYEIGSCSIDSITSVNTSGYGTGWIFNLENNVGRCYAYKLPDGKYAVLRVKSCTGAGPWTSSFDYKYQPDGSTNF